MMVVVPIQQSRRWHAASVIVAVCSFLAAALIASPPAGADDPSPPPSGGYPQWDSLARACHDGVWQSCDDLAQQTQPKIGADETLDAYNLYGLGCGGRVKDWLFGTEKCGTTATTCAQRFRPCQ